MIPFNPLDIAKFFADPTQEARNLRSNLHAFTEIPQHVLVQLAQSEQARADLENATREVILRQA